MMKKTLRYALFLMAILLAAGALFGCGAKAMAESDDAYRNPAAESPTYSYNGKGESLDVSIESTTTAIGTSGSTINLGALDPARKMIYTASYSIQTLAFDDSVDALNALTAELGGYVENSRLSGAASGDYYETRRATYTLRIPAANLQAFLDRVGTVGTVISESLSGRDVTLEYIDTESRLTALRAQETRIIELLAGATDLQYVLEIERELSDIRYQIESYTSQLNRLDSLISYSTVELTLSEVYSVTEPKPEPQSFGDKLAETFRASTSRIWDGLQAAAIWFLGNIVEIAIWVVLIGGGVLVCVLLVKKAVKKHRALPPQNPPLE